MGGGETESRSERRWVPKMGRTRRGASTSKVTAVDQPEWLLCHPRCCGWILDGLNNDNKSNGGSASYARYYKNLPHMNSFNPKDPMERTLFFPFQSWGHWRYYVPCPRSHSLQGEELLVNPAFLCSFPLRSRAARGLQDTKVIPLLSSFSLNACTNPQC
jgi:hypothetical protein